jgi:pimeloyl-ACP methyl ester carboxylesterase
VSRTSLVTSPSGSLSATGAPLWLDRALYPFQSRWHGREGERMHFVDEGRGRPLLFVHGTPSWSFEWRHALRALSARYRCVAPDHLGFGLSDKPAGADYGPEAHARRLASLVEALELRDAVLVVHDFGGPIGLPLALREPRRVGAVVVINTWMWAHGDQARIRRLSRFVASPLGRFLYMWMNASPRWIVPASFADRSRLSRSVHRHYLGPFPSRHVRRAPWALGCALAGADPYYASLWAQREALELLPTTLVWGTRDPAFGPAYLDRWRGALPHAHVRPLPVGHFPQEEAPDEVTAAIEEAASRDERAAIGVLPA